MTRQTVLLLLRVFVAAGTCLPSSCLATKWRIHIQTHRLMGGIYKVRRWDGLRCHDKYAKFHKDWFRHSNILSQWYSTFWKILMWQRAANFLCVCSSLLESIIIIIIIIIITITTTTCKIFGLDSNLWSCVHETRSVCLELNWISSLDYRPAFTSPK
jgi:hypothetical protein